MKAAVLKGPGLLELDDLPDPLCPKGGALLEIKACAVCGTDVKMRDAGPPGPLLSARSGARDGGQDRRDRCKLPPGRRRPGTGLAGHRLRKMQAMPAGSRQPLLRHQDHGIQLRRGLCQLLALPKQSLSGGVNLLPGNVDPALAALAEPLACCINGQEQACVSKGDRVLIYGGGPIGALHALLAELHGAEKIIVAERLPGRIRLLERHTSASVVDPAEESGKTVLAEEIGKAGVDVILTATPEVRVDNDLLKLLSPGGRICIFSGPAPGNYEEQIDLRSIHYHELTITGSYGCSSRQNRQAVELLTSGMIKADWIVTKRTSLARIEDAFSHSSQRTGLKSVVCGNRI